MVAAAHAKHRSPSSAKRWLSCPMSAYIVAMYPNEPTEASLKGDYWHSLMEDQLTFGTLPESADPNAVEAMQDLQEYVDRRRAEMGGARKTQLYVEQVLDIPETEEFGTADVILVSDREIEVIDEKSGYVPVHVKGNAQMLLYLLGAIAKFGERSKYTVTIHQPNYDHIDGPIRSWVVSGDDIDWIRQEIAHSMKYDDECAAGKHCKDTYCPHRGSCQVFMDYVRTNLSLGWHTSELRSMDDSTLSMALDAADELSGWRDMLRKEAIVRILKLDRKVKGYKLVRGRRDRSIKSPAQLVRSVYANLGAEYAIKLFPDLDFASDALARILDSVCNSPTIVAFPESLLKNIGSAKHVEDIVKSYARASKLPRGGWKAIYDNVVGEYIAEAASGLTLEKEIDGRPAHKPGSEFGSITSANPGTLTNLPSII